MKRIGVVLILVCAFLGLADSVYLTQNEVAGTPLLCNIQHLTGCNIVAQSAYSYMFGVPTAEYGLIFYGLLFVLAAVELAVFNWLLRRVLQVMAIGGVTFSLYSVLLQFFVIHALCIYCLASAVLALLVFIFACFIEPLPPPQRT